MKTPAKTKARLLAKRGRVYRRAAKLEKAKAEPIRAAKKRLRARGGRAEPSPSATPAALARQKAEETHRAILEALPDLVFRFDKDGVFLDYSASNPADLLLKPQEFLGRKAKDVMPSELARLIEETLERVSQMGCPQSFEYQVEQKGQVQYWEGRMTKCGQDQFLAICRNVTERKSSEEFSRRLLEESPIGMLCLDGNGIILYENPVLARLMGVPKGTQSPVIGRNILELPSIRESAAVPLLERALAGEPICGEILHYRSLMGPEVTLEAYSTPLMDKAGRQEGTLIMLLNITQQTKAEKIRHSIYQISEAAQSASSLDELFRSIHDTIGKLLPAKNFYIAIYDSERGLLSFPYFVDEYDATPAPRPLGNGMTEYILRTGRPMLVSPEVFEDLARKGEVESMGTPSIDWLGVPLKKEGKTFGALVVQTYTEGIRYRDEDKNMLEFVSTQVSMAIDRRRMEEELRNLSLTDELTELYNRRGFMALAKQQLKLASRLRRKMLLVYIDIDDLKRVNDTLGHHEGDRVLIETAEALKKTFRESDLVARLGGDEFVVLAMGASGENSRIPLSRLQADLDSRGAGRVGESKLTISSGVAHFDPEHPRSLEELLNEADQQMYKQKRLKRGQENG